MNLTIDLRTPDEVQRAHDLLIGLVLNEKLFHQIVEEDTRPLIIAALDVLCWTLNHKHNTLFASNLVLLEQMLADLGVRLRDTGKLTVPGDIQ